MNDIAHNRLGCFLALTATLIFSFSVAPGCLVGADITELKEEEVVMEEESPVRESEESPPQEYSSADMPAEGAGAPPPEEEGFWDGPWPWIIGGGVVAGGAAAAIIASSGGGGDDDDDGGGNGPSPAPTPIPVPNYFTGTWDCYFTGTGTNSKEECPDLVDTLILTQNGSSVTGYVGSIGKGTTLSGTASGNQVVLTGIYEGQVHMTFNLTASGKTLSGTMRWTSSGLWWTWNVKGTRVSGAELISFGGNGRSLVNLLDRIKYLIIH